MFQLKDFASITASMLNHARATTKKITDWLPGSVARTIIEAPAVEIEEFYIRLFLGIREAIPVATFKSFGFDKLPAAYARGFVSVSTDTPPATDLLIPLGTEFTTDDGRKYFSTEAVTWLAGEDSVRIPVVAAAAGLAYNVSVGAITGSPFFDETFTVSNSAISNGRDVETDSEREARFAEYIASLSRGTVPACLYAARSATVLDEDGNISEYVTRVGINELAGHVRIYIYSSGGVASDALLANGQRLIDGWRDPDTNEIIPGYRAGGVRVDILPIQERAVPWTAAVEMLSGYELDAAVIQSLEDTYVDLLSTVQPGDVLHVGTIESALSGVTGVKRVVPSSTSNIICDVFEALVPGTFTITEL